MYGFENLSADEQIYVRRMLPHFMAGKSASEAAAAVLEDDARLFSARCDDSHQYQGFNDASHSYVSSKARCINSGISAEVYRRLRAPSPTQPQTVE